MLHGLGNHIEIFHRIIVPLAPAALEERRCVLHGSPTQPTIPKPHRYSISPKTAPKALPSVSKGGAEIGLLHECEISPETSEMAFSDLSKSGGTNLPPFVEFCAALSVFLPGTTYQQKQKFRMRPLIQTIWSLVTIRPSFHSQSGGGCMFHMYGNWPYSLHNLAFKWYPWPYITFSSLPPLKKLSQSHDFCRHRLKNLSIPALHFEPHVVLLVETNG
jgi:hypothetical protein